MPKAEPKTQRGCAWQFPLTVAIAVTTTALILMVVWFAKAKDPKIGPTELGIFVFLLTGVIWGVYQLLRK